MQARCRVVKLTTGSSHSFVCDARAVTLALCVLIDMPPDIAICRQQFIGDLHITLGIVFLECQGDIQTDTVEVIIH